MPNSLPRFTALQDGAGGNRVSDRPALAPYILQVYAKNGMNKQKTSDELGISLKTLYNKLHKYEEERQRRAS